MDGEDLLAKSVAAYKRLSFVTDRLLNISSLKFVTHFITATKMADK